MASFSDSNLGRFKWIISFSGGSSSNHKSLIINQKIIQFIETDTFWPLNIMKWFYWSGWVYGSNYIMFYNRSVQNDDLADIWTSLQIYEKVLFLLTGSFTLVWTTFIKICGKFMENVTKMVAFIVRNIILNDIFNVIQIKMYLKICQRI